MALLLCSFNEAVRQRWHLLLSKEYALYQASTLNELKKMISCDDIDMLLLHRSMVDEKMIGQICLIKPSRKIFVLSDRPSDEEGLALLKLGIIGYANTYISPVRFSESVRVASSGSVWIGQKVMQRLIRETLSVKGDDSSLSDGVDEFETLTKRERQIADLVADGQSNLEIAAHLHISERTVKAHLSSVYSKTGSANRLNLALMVKGRGQG